MNNYSNRHRKRLVNHFYTQSGKAATRVAEAGKLASTLRNVPGPQPDTEPAYNHPQPQPSSLKVKLNSQIIEKKSVQENVDPEMPGFLIRENARLHAQVRKLDKELADAKEELVELKSQKGNEYNEELRRQIAQMQVQMINIAKVTNATHELVSENRQTVQKEDFEEESYEKLTFPVRTADDIELIDQKMITDSKFEAKVIRRIKRAKQNGTERKLILDDAMNVYTLSPNHVNVRGKVRKLATNSPLFRAMIDVLGVTSMKLLFINMKNRITSKNSTAKKKAAGTGIEQTDYSLYFDTDEVSPAQQEGNTMEYPPEMEKQMINTAKGMEANHEIVTRSCTKTNRTNKSVTGTRSGNEGHFDQVSIITDEASHDHEEKEASTEESIIAKQEDTMEYRTEMEKQTTNTAKGKKSPQKTVTKIREKIRDHKEVMPILAFPLMTLQEVEYLDKRMIADSVFEAKVIRKIRKAQLKGTEDKLITDDVMNGYTFSPNHVNHKGKVRKLATESPLFKAMTDILGEATVKLMFTKMKNRITTRASTAKKRATGVGTGTEEHTERSINLNTNQKSPDHGGKRARTEEVLDIQPENTSAYPVELFFPEDNGDGNGEENTDPIIFIKLEDLE